MSILKRALYAAGVVKSPPKKGLLKKKQLKCGTPSKLFGKKKKEDIEIINPEIRRDRNGTPFLTTTKTTVGDERKKYIDWLDNEAYAIAWREKHGLQSPLVKKFEIQNKVTERRYGYAASKDPRFDGRRLPDIGYPEGHQTRERITVVAETDDPKKARYAIETVRQYGLQPEIYGKGYLPMSEYKKKYLPKDWNH